MQDGVLQLELPRSDAVWSPAASLPAFVVGPENALLRHPVERLLTGDNVAEAARLFNPLILVGPSGSGKSQLAQAIVRHWRRSLDEHEAVYFTAADFGRELQAARADDQVAQWRVQFNSVRLLVIEGLENFRRGGAAYHELRQVLDAVIDRDGIVVFTANREPALLMQIDAGLRDRLAGGLTLRLSPPATAARRAILRLAARERGISLDDRQLNNLASVDAADVPQLLERLDDVNHESPPIPSTRPDVALKQILAVVARYFTVTQAALVGPSRRKSLVEVRNVVVYLARRLTRLSYERIGRELGGRDHTTIMHAEARLAETLPSDPNLQQTIEELERILSC